MSNRIYEASVYSREVSYRNFRGEEKVLTLYFALDPLQLLALISTFEPRKSKSGNPALKGRPEPISEEDQFKFIQNLASKAAGSPSEDGENWVPFTDFADTIAGKAFMTKLASSDGDRREFAEKVILDPFRAFVGFAKEDESNTPKDVQQFEQMLAQIENVFKMPDPSTESIEEKRARLAREMEMLNSPDQMPDE